MSPDGEVLAYVEQGVTRTTGRIGLRDMATGSTRFLEWAPDEDDHFLTLGRIHDLAFSPDGTRLAFVSSYEGQELWVVDVDASSLSDARSLGASAVEPAWTDDGGILAIELCCYPDFEEYGARLRVSVDAPETGTSDPVADDAVDIAIGGGLIAVVSADGSLEVGPQSAGQLGAFEIDGTVLNVGL